VTGANLKQRIEAIMTNHLALKLNFAKKAALTAAGIAALAAPIAVGVLDAPAIQAQAEAQSPQVAVPVVARQIPVQSAPAATPQAASDLLMGLGVVTATTVTVKSRVDGQLLSVGFKEGDLVQAGQLLASIDPETYQAQLTQAEAQLARDQAQLAAAEPVPVAMVAQLATDEANLVDARRRLAYTQIAAPIAGMAGLRLVDPGNMVHADATGIVIINQLQPIAVVFTLPEDVLPQVLARGNQGAGLPVEV
jgi:multidrug efflux system membrane fusion protein